MYLPVKEFSSFIISPSAPINYTLPHCLLPYDSKPIIHVHLKNKKK